MKTINHSRILEPKQQKTWPLLAFSSLAFAAAFGACNRAQLVTLYEGSPSVGAGVCNDNLSIGSYLEPQLRCYTPQQPSFDNVFHLDKSRLRTPAIPCNDVKLVSMASTATFDFPKAIQEVATRPLFDPSQLPTMLRSTRPEDSKSPNSPALSSPHHEAMVELIRKAQRTIFFNAIIFGGRWGTELVREMIYKSRRDNVEVVILRDTQNSFAFASELVPLWKELKRISETEASFTVLEADIHTRTFSGIPFGLDRLTSLFDRFAKEGISLSGRSDHSKILIVDGFEPRPAMLVSSKNPSDYNLLNYDESALVRGPAAAAAQVAFMNDIRLAEKMALKPSDPEATQLTDDDKDLLKRWYQAEAEVRDLGPRGRVFAPVGTAKVELSENNADDSVRNTEMGVLHLLESATKSIRMYHFLTYNPAVARALARAAIRLGPDQVQILADATLTFPLNITFVEMLEMELKSLGSDIDPRELVRWRRTTPPLSFGKETGRIGITQQQHAKSIIIDDQTLYLGSTNFDFASLGGAFREFSVSIADASIAHESAMLFESIWNDPSEWMGTKEVLETGGPTAASVPSPSLRRLLVNTIRTEQARTGSLVPENIQPTCERVRDH